MAAPPAESTIPARIDGYAAIGDYGAIGDGRASALVARDGAVDWLCLPRHDAGSVFGALLDPEQGGSFVLRPKAETYGATRRYLERTNVLETTYETATGRARVTEAVTTDGGRLLPWFELVRRVDAVAGEVEMRWQVTPRFGYGTAPVRISRIDDVLTVAESEAGSLGLVAWDVGRMNVEGDRMHGEFTVRDGGSATLALVFTVDEPLAVPRRDEVNDRLERTAQAWREWLGAHSYEGPWREHVERSLLALRLMTDPSGAVVAAPTTSLPERIGGDRNYDYRHSWPRDTAFYLDALLHTGLREPAHESFAWLLRALEDTHPSVRPVYRLGGQLLAHTNELSFRGYRGSQPVREGNDAADQLQLGVFGDLLHTAWLYSRLGNRLDAGTGRRLAENADLLCELWHEPDSGIWELPERQRYTVSRMGTWLAFDRALGLAAESQLPGDRVDRWQATRDEVAGWIEANCWSEERGSYLQYPGSDSLDAASLLLGRMGYHEVAQDRFARTVDAIGRELREGAYVYRLNALREEEGAFVACSFWLAEALKRCGRDEEAADLFEAALGIGNDLGLYSEEADPSTRELLGNFPQGLSHLSLINAAGTLG